MKWADSPAAAEILDDEWDRSDKGITETRMVSVPAWALAKVLLQADDMAREASKRAGFYSDHRCSESCGVATLNAALDVVAEQIMKADSWCRECGRPHDPDDPDLHVNDESIGD